MPILNKNKPIALSSGDCTGIAPEITQKAWQALRQSDDVFFVIGDPAFFEGAAIITQPQEAADCFAERLPLLARPSEKSPAQAAWAALDCALDFALAGDAAALVSNPVNKARLAEIGWQAPGQTEYLAERCGTQSLMMLATSTMRCALITTHMALRDVSAALSTEKIIAGGKILEAALKNDFGIAQPKIGVAALNPHGGDGGLMGDEEARIIAPAVATLGENFSPPLPADSLFAKKGFDAFLCMFHDQALIPIKMQQEAAVNITLGLPIIRTSPDHGTAFDIVGKNIADPASLIQAIKMAATLANNRHA